MIIGGIEKCSLVDFPGRTAAVIFTRGCNFRCRYCHNPTLVYPDLFAPSLSEDDVFEFLDRRRGKLEGVVISGGEPTLQRDLIPFIGKIKAMGYLVKLDTNGSNPAVLRELFRLNMLDFIAMDIKAPFNKYSNICGVDTDIGNIRESIHIIENSRVGYRFRTTYDTDSLDGEDLDKIRLIPRDPVSLVVQDCLKQYSN